MHIAVYDETGKRVGHGSKSHVHVNGLWHCSVLLVVVHGGRLLIYQRGSDQSWSGCWDLLGGHQDADDATIMATAFRELSEELVVGAGLPSLPTANLTLVGREGCLVSARSDNRERTSVFVYACPIADIQVQDQGDHGQTLTRASRWVTLTELRQTEEHRPIADGLQRFLAHMDADREFCARVYAVVGHTKWRIGFGCTRPGEPGCGCPDNNFYAEEIVDGSYADAKQMATTICRERYYGDFVSWIDPVLD